MDKWGKLEKDLYNIAADRYREDIPEVEFIVSLIVCAAENKMYWYFNDSIYKKHCRLVRLDSRSILKLFELMWGDNA